MTSIHYSKLFSAEQQDTSEKEDTSEKSTDALTKSSPTPPVASSFFVRSFNKKHGMIDVDLLNLDYSYYVYLGLHEVLVWFDNWYSDGGVDGWVLCVQYKENKKKRTPADVQFGFGGKIPENMTPEDACIKEAREETGFVFDKKNMLKFSETYFQPERLKPFTTSIFAVNAKDCTFCGNVENGKQADTWNKVGCILHGSYDELVTLLSTAIPNETMKLNDDIISMIPVPIFFACNIIAKMRGTKDFIRRNYYA